MGDKFIFHERWIDEHTSLLRREKDSLRHIQDCLSLMRYQLPEQYSWSLVQLKDKVETLCESVSGVEQALSDFREGVWRNNEIISQQFDEAAELARHVYR